MADIVLLKPVKTQGLYYSGKAGSSNDVTIAKVKLTFQHDSVNLDHSSHIASVKCNSAHNNMQIVLGTADKFTTVKSQWAANTVYITSSPSCDTDAQNAMFLANTISFDQAALTVTLTGSPKHIADVYDNFKIDFGEVSVPKSTRSLTERASYSKSLTIPMNVAPPSKLLSTSPWGNQMSLYKLGSPDANGFEIFCVNCGITGSFTMTGTASASLLHGLEDAFLQVTGNLHAGLYLGLNAHYSGSKSTNVNILTVPIGAVSVPKLLTIGPTLSLGASVNLNLNAQGQVLVGGALDWPAISAKLDFVKTSTSGVSGFKPNFSHTFTANGQATLTAGLGLPISLAVGISILDGHWKYSLALKDTPALNLGVSFSATTNNKRTIGNSTHISPMQDLTINGGSGCYGFPWTVGLSNVAEFDYGSNAKTLFSTGIPAVATGCLGVNRPITTTTTTTTTTTPPPATTAPADTEVPAPTPTGGDTSTPAAVPSSIGVTPTPTAAGSAAGGSSSSSDSGASSSLPSSGSSSSGITGDSTSAGNSPGSSSSGSNSAGSSPSGATTPGSASSGSSAGSVSSGSSTAPVSGSSSGSSPSSGSSSSGSSSSGSSNSGCETGLFVAATDGTVFDSWSNIRDYANGPTGINATRTFQSCINLCATLGAVNCAAVVWVESGMDQQYCLPKTDTVAHGNFPTGIRAFSAIRNSGVSACAGSGFNMMPYSQ
ncbi:hypothetical protein K461DRAFT_324547 [Myriangium duriaei CBS 260.36]|uniref:Apple domain-containing protein n=1 Tax=Myriangium duriaei CBS 260.36 TaxID=1168546 RepID=A0A9P4IWS9_9PEZI|nr:hypothetical protein K461DRAFT_324547 [Myriangium duriaei CBS 260.36]